MGYYRTPLDVPVRYQWDADSRLPLPDPGTAPGNCGMTCVAHVAQYYTEKFTGIYHTRRLSTTEDWKMSTTISEQSLSLTKLGVPNIISRPTVAQITKYLSTGRRPIIVGLNMARVPATIRDHPFEGSHAILLRANARRTDSVGKNAMDPNFNRTYRLDPDKGQKYYPNWVLEYAYYDAGMWAIVPLNDKQVPPPWYGRVRVIDGNNRHIRESAKEIAGNTWAISRPDGYTHRVSDNQKLFRNAYLYHWNGEVRNGFYVLKTHSGDTKFIKQSAAKVARQP